MSVTTATIEHSTQDTQNGDSTTFDHEGLVEQETIYYPIVQRDPMDIRTILRLSLVALTFAFVSLVLAGLLTYRLTRRPEVIVVERTPAGDRVVGDDRLHTLQGSIQMQPDTPGDGDKKYLASKWGESFFQVDPQTRRADLVRGLKLMTPDAAVTLVDQVKQSGEWETQRREEWQATWKQQVVTINPDDSYKVQLVGKQEIVKSIAGALQRSTRQIICTLALRSDSAKRTEDNLNTGFRVAGIVEMKVLDGDAGASESPSISVATPQANQ